jgi:hypothetical protein
MVNFYGVLLQVQISANLQSQYVPDDVLEEASASKYQMLLTKSKLRYQKELEKCAQLQCVRRIKEIDKKCHDGIF